MVYELKSYPNNAPQAPLPTDSEIKDEENFWSKLENGPLKTVQTLAKLDVDSEIIDTDYSVNLNYWGVELQRANHLKEAHKQFAEAVQIKPDNYIATINLRYNEALQKGDHRPIGSIELFERALAKYGGLVGVLKLNGPPDEPDAILQVGEIMAVSGNLRQAASLFTRRLELLPADPQAELDMAKTYADRGKLDKVTVLIDKLRSNPAINQWELTRVKAMAYLAASSNSAAETLLQNAVRENPTDPARIGTLAELYLRVGYEALHRSQADRARSDFSAALTNFDMQIKLLSAPGRSADDGTLAPTLLKKAQMQVMLGQLSAAVATLSTILKMQPDNTTALLNRAVAEGQLKRIAAAKADYAALAHLEPQQRYLIDYHLADVAALETNVTEEIRFLRRYLSAAPDESPEYSSVQKRLETLERR
jgi:tetratricopeptide (TPR) repeat protein